MTIIDNREHPDNLDPTAKVVWQGHEQDPNRRFLPTIYRMRHNGFVLVWHGPGWGVGHAVLEPFATQEAAIEAWREIYETPVDGQPAPKIDEVPGQLGLFSEAV